MLPVRKEPTFTGNMVSSTSLYKHQVFSSLRYVKFPSWHTFRFIRDHSVTELTFGGSLAGISSVLFISSSPFILLVPPCYYTPGQSTYWKFCASSPSFFSKSKIYMIDYHCNFPRPWPSLLLNTFLINVTFVKLHYKV